MSSLVITGTTVLSYWDGPDYFMSTSGVGPFEITGITEGGPDGCPRKLVNNGPDPITIVHNHLLTPGGERIYLTSGLSFILLPAGHYIELIRNWSGPSGAGWYDHA